MKDWFKKHLGWIGFLVFFFGITTGVVSNYFFDYKVDSILIFACFSFMGGAQTIQDILNEKLLSKSSEKVKKITILLIILITILFIVPLFIF